MNWCWLPEGVKDPAHADATHLVTDPQWDQVLVRAFQHRGLPLDPYRDSRFDGPTITEALAAVHALCDMRRAELSAQLGLVPKQQTQPWQRHALSGLLASDGRYQMLNELELLFSSAMAGGRVLMFGD